MTAPDLEALARESRTLITVPIADVNRLDTLATMHHVPTAFGRAVNALERELTRFTNPAAWGRRCLADLRIILGLDPLAELLDGPPPADRLTEDERHELQEAIWRLGEDLAIDEEVTAEREAAAGRDGRS